MILLAKKKSPQMILFCYIVLFNGKSVPSTVVSLKYKSSFSCAFNFFFRVNYIPKFVHLIQYYQGPNSIKMVNGKC